MKTILVITTLICLLVTSRSSFGQQSSNTAPLIPDQNWTASDKPYKDAEQEIKAEYAKGKSLASITEERHAIALAHPKDPVAQFAWVCAGRGAAWVSSSEGSLPRYLLNTLTKSDPGNVRVYTRYRFCLTDETDLILPVQNAELIGNKLLAANPKDNWVRLSLINILCAAPGGDVRALPHALNWVQTEPGNSKAHSSLAQVYFDLWEKSGRKDQVLGHKAIIEFQRYLKIAPMDDGFRHQAQSYISHIQQA